MNRDTPSWIDVSESLWNSTTEPNVAGSVTPRALSSIGIAWLGSVSAVIGGIVIWWPTMPLNVDDSCCRASFTNGR